MAVLEERVTRLELEQHVMVQGLLARFDTLAERMDAGFSEVNEKLDALELQVKLLNSLVTAHGGDIDSIRLRESKLFTT